jgi:hypothetical protein
MEIHPKQLRIWRHFTLCEYPDIAIILSEDSFDSSRYNNVLLDAFPVRHTAGTCRQSFEERLLHPTGWELPV